MQVNLKRLDARIQKLQEIRRIAADPELVRLLLEFLGNEEEHNEAEQVSTAPLKVPLPSSEEIGLVDQVLEGLDPQARSSWAVKRASV